MISTNISPQQTNLSPGTLEKEVSATLATLSTPVKVKRKMQTLMYFMTRKSARVKQGRPQTPNKTPITIKEPPNRKDEIGLEDGKIQGVTSPEKTPVTYIRRHSSRLVSLEQVPTPTDLQEVENEGKKGK